MDEFATIRAIFPLDLTCPACEATPVEFTVTIPDRSRVAVKIECVCGQAVDYGTLPAQVSEGTESSAPKEQR